VFEKSRFQIHALQGNAIMSTVLPQKPGGMLTKNVTVRTGLASSSAVNDGKNFTYLHVILIYCVLIVAVVKEGVKTHRFCSVPTLCASISHPPLVGSAVWCKDACARSSISICTEGKKSLL